MRFGTSNAESQFDPLHQTNGLVSNAKDGDIVLLWGQGERRTRCVSDEKEGGKDARLEFEEVGIRKDDGLYV